MKGRTSRANTSLLDNIGLELLKADPGEQLADNSLRIEYIPAELVRPDPIQPRRVLPEPIHLAFHANRLTPVQALRELIQIAQVVARQNSRPFNSLLDFFADSEDDRETEPPRLSPEEQLVRDLVNLAVTIRDDGQVNPLTVVDVTQGVTRLYRIETGERRYWATWLLRDFLSGYEGDGTIPCILIPSGRASVFRQAKENTARAGLSAIAMARQAALLLLTAHGIERPEGAVPNDFYRQALDMDMRDKREFTSAILSAMGGISRMHFSRYKALLRLSDEALELADRHNLDERQLRYVLTLPEDSHTEMVRQIIDFGLTGQQVKQLCEGSKTDTDHPPIPRQILQLAKLIRSDSPPAPEDIARLLLEQEHDAQIVRARLQNMKKLLDAAESYLIDR